MHKFNQPATKVHFSSKKHRFEYIVNPDLIPTAKENITYFNNLFLNDSKVFHLAKMLPQKKFHVFELCVHAIVLFLFRINPLFDRYKFAMNFL